MEKKYKNYKELIEKDGVSYFLRLSLKILEIIKTLQEFDKLFFHLTKNISNSNNKKIINKSCCELKILYSTFLLLELRDYYEIVTSLSEQEKYKELNDIKKNMKFLKDLLDKDKTYDNDLKIHNILSFGAHLYNEINFNKERAKTCWEQFDKIISSKLLDMSFEEIVHEFSIVASFFENKEFNKIVSFLPEKIESYLLNLFELLICKKI